jgi:pSer/pThr/pTyr-binding forkhead associated (FHA) protein
METMLGSDVPRKPEEGEGYRVCGQDRSVLLGDGEVVIGRSSYCSLVLDHESLSRVHASLRIVGDGVELGDLGSSNGTFINGRAIEGPTKVTPADEIRLGKVKIWIEVASARVSETTGRFTQVSSDAEDTTIANRNKAELHIEDYPFKPPRSGTP